MGFDVFRPGPRGLRRPPGGPPKPPVGLTSASGDSRSPPGLNTSQSNKSRNQKVSDNGREVLLTLVTLQDSERWPRAFHQHSAQGDTRCNPIMHRLPPQSANPHTLNPKARQRAARKKRSRISHLRWGRKAGAKTASELDFNCPRTALRLP